MVYSLNMALNVNIKNQKATIDKDLIVSLGEDSTFMGFDLDSKGRVIAVHTHGAVLVEELLVKREKGSKVVYKDNNKLNLTLGNLALVKREHLKGVYFYPKNQMRKWKAIISVKGKKIALGYFSTEAEAKAAYDKAFNELKGS